MSSNHLAKASAFDPSKVVFLVLSRDCDTVKQFPKLLTECAISLRTSWSMTVTFVTGIDSFTFITLALKVLENWAISSFERTGARHSPAVVVSNRRSTSLLVPAGESAVLGVARRLGSWDASLMWLRRRWVVLVRLVEATGMQVETVAGIDLATR